MMKSKKPSKILKKEKVLFQTHGIVLNVCSVEKKTKGFEWPFPIKHSLLNPKEFL